MAIAVPTVGAGLALESSLRATGRAASWRSDLVEGPDDEAPAPFSVILLDADALGDRLLEVAQRWRESSTIPGLVAIGDGELARALAPRARMTLLSGRASTATLVAAIDEAFRLRHAGALSWPMLRGALQLREPAPSAEAIGAAATGARAAALEVPQTALGPLASCYVTGTALLDAALQARTLALPDQHAARACDGTRTLRTLVRHGPSGPPETARLLWVLGCAGAVTFTAEVRDDATPRRRALGELRRHLRERQTRLAGSTYYDVLEVTPRAEAKDLDHAMRALALRYAPQVLAAHDLAELAALTVPSWELVERARATLCDPASRGRYHDWLRTRPALRTTWAIEPEQATRAEAAFARGQAALASGDVHRAVGELAQSCRLCPGHPEPEATLAWARYRVMSAGGGDRAALARKERAFVEDLLLGRRPWPRAQVALAMLCAAGDDVESAQWYVAQALAVEPNLPGALALRERLGR